MKIINPATDECIREIAEDSKEAIIEKWKLAKLGKIGWANTLLSERVRVIKKYADLLVLKSEELAQILTSETGKPLTEARNEIKGASARIKFFVENSQEWLGQRVYNNSAAVKEVLRFKPLGVIANISAWNYPYLVGVNVHIPALIGGNAILYKPSEFATLSGLKMGELLIEAGLPPEVFQIVVGAEIAGEVLVDLPLDGYFFTGSYQTGQKIQQAVAPKLVPVGLELGGKDPLYVTDEIVSVKEAAVSAVGGAFYNNGQSCCAIERIYVHQNIFSEFVEHFVNEVRSLKVGDPTELQTTQGPLTREAHIKYLMVQIDDAINRGADLLCGGSPIEGKGQYFAPTVLTNVNHQMLLMKEETFGPVIGIQSVVDDQEAVKLMDDTTYGLTAAVFTSNLDRAERILAQLEVGNAYVNCSDRVSPYLPWAGQRGSGLGATLGFPGILAFVRPMGFHIARN